MDNPNIPSALKRAIQDNARQFRTLGIVLIVLGAAAILFPLVASVAIKVLLGWFFLMTGGAVLWNAFQARGWSPALLSGLVGIIHLSIGVYLAFFPLTGLIGLTMLMAIVFLTQGVLEAAMAWQHRPGHGNEGPGWAWMGLSAAVTIVLGVMLLAGLPGTALWALGLFAGINFLTSGISFVVLANTATKL